MHRYHQKLIDAGIEGYSFEVAWRDYLRGIVIGARLLPMLAANELDTDSEGGAALAEKAYRAIPEAILDHGGVDLIDELLQNY